MRNATAKISTLPHIQVTKNPIINTFKADIFVVCVGLACTGSMMAWTSPVLPQLVPVNGTNTSAPFTLTPTQVSIVGSMLSLSGILAALPAGYLADKIGRRKCLLIFLQNFIISNLLVVFAQSVEYLYVARFFGGLGAGAMQVLCVVYASEVSSVEIRGSLTSLPSVFLWSGILITYVLGAFFNWRALSGVLILLPATAWILVWRLPETPAYLYMSGRYEDVKRVLFYFNGRNYDIANDLALLQQLEKEKTAKKISPKSLFSVKPYRKALGIAIMLKTLQQSCGMNVVILYSGLIFRAAGGLNSYTAAIIMAVVKVAAAQSVSSLIEKAGRRFFMFTSLIGMCVCLIILGAFFQLKDHLQLPKACGYLAVVDLCLFGVFFCLGAASIPPVILGEIFTPHVKGVAGGIIYEYKWCIVFLWTFGFPIHTIFGIHYAFYLFAVVVAVGCVGVHFFLPETKGKTLQEILVMLEK